MSADRFQKVTADHLRRDAFLYIRQSSLRQVMETLKARSDSIHCVIGPFHWVGQLSVFTLSIVTWGCPALVQRIVTVFSVWSLKWQTATPVSYWVWKSHAWPEIMPTGIA